MSLRRGLIACWCLVGAGCAAVTERPAPETVALIEPAATVTTPLEADDALAPESASAVPATVLSDAAADSLEALPVAVELPRGVPTEEAAPPAVVVPAAPASRALEVAVVPPAVALPAAETLDLSSLATRLRETKAIGLLTKVAVKNESDDLLDQFRAYHTQTGMATLADLRRSYDLLFHKLHSLLEDADPPLARDIDRSRTAIWELLADPRKFRASLLMAGA